MVEKEVSTYDPPNRDDECLRGITHCYPHGNRMPCAKCGEELIQKTGEKCGLCGKEIDGVICNCSIEPETEQ